VTPGRFPGLARAHGSAFLTHPTFHRYRSEHEMLRYLHRLQAKDLSLTTSMIPLGSCTMKLNATTEMIPVTWPEFGAMHPFAPAGSGGGYQRCSRDLEAGSPRSPASRRVAAAERRLAGRVRGPARDPRLPPGRGQGSARVPDPGVAHGTNPASRGDGGMKVVVVACDDDGNVDLATSREGRSTTATTSRALMVTYPSTHGVFESDGIKRSARSCTRTAARSTWTAPT
jgi:glycine dehydrogenase